MLQLLAIFALPVFLSEVSGEGEIRTIGTIQNSNGYFTVSNIRDFPGAVPDTYLSYLDNSGESTQGYYLGSQGEAMQLCSFSGKKTILVRKPLQNSVVVLQVGGAESRYPAFEDQFMGGVSMFPGMEHLLLAGNDDPSNGPVRVAVINQDMEVLSNQLFPDVQMEVVSVSLVDGETCVLGSTGLNGWERDVALFFPGSMEVLHFIPQSGRFSPVELLPLDEGCIMVCNAITGENGQIGGLFLMKLDGSLSIDWTVTLYGESWLSASAADATGEGIIVTGWTNDLPMSEVNRSDIFLAEFSLDGDLLWTTTHGGGTVDYGLDVTTCTDGGFAVSGCFADDLYNGLVLRTDSLGTLEGMGLEEQGTEQPLVSVLQNPSRCGTIGILLPEGIGTDVSVSLIDMSGRIVERTSAAGGGTAVFTGVPPGVYLVQVSNAQAVNTIKVTVTGGAL